MVSRIKKAVVFLDMVLLVMTGSWILFGISQGIDAIELIYNYVYVLVALVALLLNIKIIYEYE